MNSEMQIIPLSQAENILQVQEDSVIRQATEPFLPVIRITAAVLIMAALIFHVRQEHRFMLRTPVMLQ